MKIYLNEEIGKLKQGLESCKKDADVASDSTLKDKIDKVYSILESYKDKEIDTDLIELVLKTQDLVQEINSNDNID